MKRDLLVRLRSDIENVTDAWLNTALKSLLHIQSRSERSALLAFLLFYASQRKHVMFHRQYLVSLPAVIVSLLHSGESA